MVNIDNVILLVNWAERQTEEDPKLRNNAPNKYRIEQRKSDDIPKRIGTRKQEQYCQEGQHTKHNGIKLGHGYIQ